MHVLKQILTPNLLQKGPIPDSFSNSCTHVSCLSLHVSQVSTASNYYDNGVFPGDIDPRQELLSVYVRKCSHPFG